MPSKVGATDDTGEDACVGDEPGRAAVQQCMPAPGSLDAMLWLGHCPQRCSADMFVRALPFCFAPLLSCVERMADTGVRSLSQMMAIFLILLLGTVSLAPSTSF